MPCQAHLVEVRDQYAAIRSLGAEVLAVAMSRPEVLAAYLKMQAWPFPVVCDPERVAYRRFGLGRTSWTSFLRPSVIGGYLRLLFRGWKPRLPSEGEDPLQLGGDFLLDENQKVILAYRSRVSTDRPSVADLIAALQKVTGPDAGSPR